jgi:Protein of unknown function (DUF4089)
MGKRARAKAKVKPKRSRAAARRQARSASKPARRDPLDDYVIAAARALDLPIDPAWQGAIKTNLAVTLRLAALYADFPLPDDAEPAPVFAA